MQTFVAVTVLMIAAGDGMPEEPHTESIYATKSATLKLEVPLPARVSLPEKKIVLTETKETLEHKREIEALKLVHEKVMADKDSRLADKDSIIADKDSIIADKDSIIADKDARLADKDAIIAALEEQNKRQGPLLLPLSPSRKLLMDQGVSSAETSQLSCKNTENYGFIHADSDKFTKGAWSRFILDTAHIYSKSCDP